MGGWSIGAAGILYLAGAVAIHIMGPSQFIFWEMGLPGPLPKLLWSLYGGWIFWVY